MFICIHEIVFRSEAKCVLCVKAETESLCFSFLSETFPPVTTVKTSTRFHERLETNQKNKRSLLKSFAIFPEEICPQTGGALSNSHLFECLPAACLPFLEAALFFPEEHQHWLSSCHQDRCVTSLCEKSRENRRCKQKHINQSHLFHC